MVLHRGTALQYPVDSFADLYTDCGDVLLNIMGEPDKALPFFTCAALCCACAVCLCLGVQLERAGAERPAGCSADQSLGRLG